jgi:hypothetical protein
MFGKFLLTFSLITLSYIGNVRAVNIAERDNQATQPEAKIYVLTMNRGQQAFYAENSRFASTLEELMLGLRSETKHYSYSIVLSNDRRFVQSIGLAKKIDGWKNYTGIVYLVNPPEAGATSSLLCESDRPSKENPGKPVANSSNGELQCPLGYSPVVR